MGYMSNEELREYCKSLEQYSVEELEERIHHVEFQAMISGGRQDRMQMMVPPDFVNLCLFYLKRNHEKVEEIIKKYHSDVSTMVYSLGLVVGNQIIQTGKINELTVVYTVLMYLGKIGLDKLLSGSK